MGVNTSISWADHTFNPWVGCTKVGPACDHCYAEDWGARFGQEWGPHAERRRTSASNWRQPLAWDRAASKAGTRPFVFCASLGDVFDNQIPTEWRLDLFGLIRTTPNLVWLLLTKRPGNITRLFREATALDQQHDPLSEYWPSNAAIGCTIVTQAEADRDLPELRKAKAALRPAFAFVSMEPLLERVDLTHLPCLDWVITGGESGPHARPTPCDAETSIRDQCAAARVPYHRKQAGEWIRVQDLRRLPDGHGPGFGAYDHCRYDIKTETLRVGKAAAGHLLDGVEHRARPVVRL